jgi:2-keto-3-deoxy-L-rhamnonate aldolase RhmA
MSSYLGRSTPIGRSLLGRPQPPVGVLVIEISSPALWMMFANAGADFGVVDMEHSSLSHRDVARLVLGARSTTLPAIVRVPELSHSAIGRALSIGADGVLVPGVESADDARRLVRYSRFAPLGARGAAFGRGHDGFRRSDPRTVAADENEGIACIAQVESPAGVDAIEEICSTPGLDAVWLGPADLTHSLGVLGDLESDAYREAEQRVIAACRAAGMPLAIGAARTPAEIRRQLDLGCWALLLGQEVMLLQDAIARLVATIRDGRGLGESGAQDEELVAAGDG